MDLSTAFEQQLFFQAFVYSSKCLFYHFLQLIWFCCLKKKLNGKKGERWRWIFWILYILNWGNNNSSSNNKHDKNTQKQISYEYINIYYCLMAFKWEQLRYMHFLLFCRSLDCIRLFSLPEFSFLCTHCNWIGALSKLFVYQKLEKKNDTQSFHLAVHCLNHIASICHVWDVKNWICNEMKIDNKIKL